MESPILARPQPAEAGFVVAQPPTGATSVAGSSAPPIASVYSEYWTMISPSRTTTG